MDDLTRIKGIGKAVAVKLAAAGVDSFSRLALYEHDPIAAEELGIKPEWIVQAGEIWSSEGGAGASLATSTPAEQADAAGAPSGADAGPSALDTPPEAPEGTVSGHAPESDDQGGAGDPAGPAGADLDHVDFARDEFRAAYPHLSAAFEAWSETNTGAPSALRIAAKRDGFRRAGIAHGKAPVDHPLGVFETPEQMEALFAERMLTVEIVGGVPRDSLED